MAQVTANRGGWGSPTPSARAAYATAAVAMGPALARDWTEALEGYEAFAITETGDTWQTSGFAGHLARG